MARMMEGLSTINSFLRTLLALVVVLGRHDGDRTHRGVPTQQHLDLGGEHAHPLDLDHVLVAAEVVQAAVFVDAAVVAGVQPAVAQLSGGGLRFLPVAGRHRRAAHDDLAGFPEGERLPGLEGHHGDVRTSSQEQ